MGRLVWVFCPARIACTSDPLNRIGRSRMAQDLVENGYRIRITSEAPKQGELGWRAVAEAWPVDAGDEVQPITTTARHESPEGAERVALVMMRDRVWGNHVA